ncbi:amidohydrolase [Thermococcus litoralis DSM 5473]|uniref:Amidohydrolase n=1 Tax=Thermococcus litoralis (strain ATCC 51850 / DSM 5473 / JCM 8560 / NS-C) TaxID=523849 RepID=H3ZPE5_THELN|nr:amidohydrolase [Thermococcus litoralis]EHR78180.1 amidohydrolase [Thermococcus litoralis DSM 5473]
MKSKIKEEIVSFLENNKKRFVEIAQYIWENPELAFEEFKSSKILADTLKEFGFEVERGIADLPTAFVGTWGEGKPVLGLLAEYDALPGLAADGSGKPGHGCGHNLLGTASVAAGIAVKRAMEKYGLKGTIKVFGCPAEEVVLGKVIMAARGVFNGLDAVIQWHPYWENAIRYDSSNAAEIKVYRFYGKSAHAGGTPWEGKSALDAALLFLNSIEFLREHIWEKDRIHYIITKGGDAPNIVPDFAEVAVGIRSYDMKHFVELSERIDKCAIGSTLSTGTKVEIFSKGACYPILPNKVLSSVVYENLRIVGPPKFTKDILKREKLHTNISKFEGWEIGEEWRGMTASTDVGDVSWLVPTSGQLTTACAPIGTPTHSIEFTKYSGRSVGYEGMITAAKVMALSLVDILLNPDVVARAWEEFKMRKKSLEWEYKPLLPAKIESRLDLEIKREELKIENPTRIKNLFNT